MGRWSLCCGTAHPCTSQVCLVPLGSQDQAESLRSPKRSHHDLPGPSGAQRKRERPWKKEEAFDLLVTGCHFALSPSPLTPSAQPPHLGARNCLPA